MSPLEKSLETNSPSAENIQKIKSKKKRHSSDDKTEIAKERISDLKVQKKIAHSKPAQLVKQKPQLFDKKYSTHEIREKVSAVDSTIEDKESNLSGLRDQLTFLHERLSTISEEFSNESQLLAMKMESRVNSDGELSSNDILVEFEKKIHKLEDSQAQYSTILNEECKKMNISLEDLQNESKFATSFIEIASGQKNLLKCSKEYLDIYMEKEKLSKEYKSTLLKLREDNTDIDKILSNKELLKLKESLIKNSNSRLELEIGEMLSAKNSLLGIHASKYEHQKAIKKLLKEHPMYQKASVDIAKSNIKLEIEMSRF